ncbi:hypothetical protein KAFR_0A06930 [Kazachstania africana CBS 2517]|uniref:Uncharacterized protein n=1 Tax=Kazachstania africana (strain ATCC 22294 / BCRC 22015 / CBS 2517 / CECT 1963 / NBRC 1671 / NRRL Y-8276) TaxID=1071382 RepID=H2AP28_KAZAF|nr:hypothetical protein KAFR_0A06930 [Kazachstania africana CBS 2517]CCF56128.1 hypothetical protein KAFR_0A06930 [Kazachstania africana CBS 2517]
MSSIKTASEEQRKLIEQLLGKDTRYYARKELSLNDPRICKSYLVGYCPYDLFQNTKQSIGRCPQIHLQKHKLQYEKLKEEGATFPEFETEYFLVLSRFINECNNQIATALKSLEHTFEERERIKEVASELDELDTRIGLMQEEINTLITKDEVSKAMIQSIKFKELLEKRAIVAKKVKNITENVGQSAQQKLQVCEICGAYLSRLDTDRRLADHFLGKVHLGYVKMREHYNYYKNKKI